jgi:hypothetical protein
MCWYIGQGEEWPVYILSKADEEFNSYPLPDELGELYQAARLLYTKIRGKVSEFMSCTTEGCRYGDRLPGPEGLCRKCAREPKEK